jgi:hypothetical protein
MIRRYLSTFHLKNKIIYLFESSDDKGDILKKILEIIGFVLIGGTIYSYLGMIGNDLRWPVFWSCAAGTLAIIIYRRWMKKKLEKADS